MSLHLYLKCLILKCKAMKKYMFLTVMALLSLSCNGQKGEVENTNKNGNINNNVNTPKGSWKVDKEFDENGNLIRYDSIYSWSSNSKYDNLSNFDRDSLMQSFKSKFFTNFSRFENQGFDDVFSQDSLFSKRFFNDGFFGSDFGNDFMDIDRIRNEMIERQKQFLEKYHSEFIKPEEEQ